MVWVLIFAWVGWEIIPPLDAAPETQEALSEVLADSPAPSAPQKEESSPPLIPQGSPKKKGTSREAAPEAQGTQALDRFSQKEIRKSFYTLHGEALEVDPD